MLRARRRFGLSVVTQLSILASLLVILVLVQSGASLRFAHFVDGVSGQFGVATFETLSLSTGVVCALLLAPLGLAIVWRFAARLSGITETMLRIARNDINVRIPGLRDSDELGDMARAVHVFKANAVTLLEHQERIEQLNVRFDAALNNMSRGLSMFDDDERLVVCNQQFQKMYALPDVMCQPGVSLHDIMKVRKCQGQLCCANGSGDGGDWYERYTRMIANRESGTLTYRVNDGRVILITYEPMDDGGCVAIHEDITAKCRREEKINRLARKDSLTGVANRFYFRERLDSVFSAGFDESGIGIHLIDLDSFKEVNDSFGHAGGDALLRLSAARIAKSLRESDFIARLGGDEFAVIQMGVHDQDSALRAATRLLKILREPFCIQGQQVVIGASIGIALVPEYASTPEEALKKADIALYRAKEKDRGPSVVFKPELEETLRSRRQLEVDFRRAVDERELELYYQPIVGLRCSQVTSCEALMRWRHPTRGFVSPAEFIPVAEDLGLISEVGAWALRQACMDARTWPGEVKVAVNLSAAQFASCDLFKVTTEALDAAGLAPERLDLEVTESLLLKDVPSTTEVLHKLRSIGVNIALDDFGTGYASLSYLLAFPFDKIKIDRMFVCDVVEQDHPAAIVTAIVNLAQTLGIATVAEGVETPAQLRSVTKIGCDEVQGFLFSRPVPAGEIPALLARGSLVGIAAA